MSRAELKNDEYVFVVGVDHVTSAFVQVWKNPAEGQDGAFLVIDNMGVRITHEPIETLNEFLTYLPKGTEALLEEIKRRFEYAAQCGNRYPNLDAETICRIACHFGFKNSATIVYNVLD